MTALALPAATSSDAALPQPQARLVLDEPPERTFALVDWYAPDHHPIPLVTAPSQHVAAQRLTRAAATWAGPLDTQDAFQAHLATDPVAGLTPDGREVVLLELGPEGELPRSNGQARGRVARCHRAGLRRAWSRLKAARQAGHRRESGAGAHVA